MAAPPALVMVVSHTHWDREWYLPFEQFRLQLSDLVAALCDLLERTPAFAHFMLDGQTVCIEDVLALRPQLEPRLRALAGAGRLGIGPWYVLQDEFLVGGESIVRNLAEGLRVARQLGRPMAVGYLPDAFGHVAQMPRVLRGFGIDTAVLWRGVGARAPGAEWRWRGLGGAEVLGLWLPDGYGNAARLPEASTEALDKLRADLARLLPLSRAHALLWMNGVDHTWPQAHVPALLAALRQAAPEVEIAHVGLEEAVGRVRERVRMESLPVLEGELREPTEEAPVLAGVLSVRSWQKRRHDRAEALLARQAEPLAALAGRDQRAALRHAWRLLLKCQPHDSICGCSIDAVHRDVDARLRRVVQVAGAVRDQALRELAGDRGSARSLAGGLALASPHPFVATALARVEVELPRDGAPFRLLGPSGEVAFDVVSEWHSERGIKPTRQLGLRILARSLPPHGVRRLRLEAGAPTACADEMRVLGDTIENGSVRVRPAAGGLELTDLASGARIVHTLADQGDRGDEYDFSALAGDAPRSSREAVLAAAVDPGRAACALVVHGRWALPRTLSADRTRRAGAGSIGLTLRATLVGGERRVEIALELDHRVRDHRLRACFDLGAPAAALRTDTAFGWLKRAPARPHPMSSLAILDGAGVRVGVGALGLHEVEWSREGTLQLTVLRCVGWMSRSDLTSRRGHAGYQVRTPDAQGQGRRRFSYAIAFGDPGPPASALARVLEPALLPPAAVALAHAEPADLPLLAVEPAAVRLSTIRRAQDDDRLLVRLIGPDQGALTARVRCFRPLRRAWLSDLDERAGSPLAVSEQNEIAVPLPAGEVATLALELL